MLSRSAGLSVALTPAPYRGSETVPSGVTPGPAKSGFAGDPASAPTIVAQ